jgi:dihydrofolate synthase/folylpolyglutamate synthase
LRFANLDAWLSWQERLNPRAIDLGLERVAAVLARLDLAVPALLRSAGYRVGAYTSPHLLRYNERVRIDGREASDQALCEAFETVDRVRGSTRLTYFEFGTLAALVLFAAAKLDVAILEVGLGGRLDAVNCVDADVAVVTAIGLDHTDWLGADRASIAREKAGIFRPGRPAVCSGRDPPRALLASARDLGAPLYVLGRDFWHEVQAPDRWTWKGPRHTFSDLPMPKLAGAFQLDNAAGALMALTLVEDGFAWTREALAEGLRSVELAGRFQILPGAALRILDVAHNPQAADLLARTLRELPSAGRTVAVFSMLADKDLTGVVGAMSGVVDRWYVAQLDVERAAPRERLAAAVAAQARAPLELCDTVHAAYRQAVSEAREGDRIVAFGSFHTVAEVLRTDL